MGRREPNSVDLWEKAVARGYELGAHRTEDSKRNTEDYVPETLKDQNGALKRYERCVNVLRLNSPGVLVADFTDQIGG